MPWHDVDNFLNEVCKHIKYKKAHSEISEELQNHIKDRIQDFIHSDFDEETAIKKAVEAMGNPVELGIELNKFHKPYLGWLLSTINTLVVLAGLFAAYIIIPSIFLSFESFNQMPSSKNIEYSVSINEKDRIDDRTVLVKKLVIDKNGTVYIRYNDYCKLFSQGWSMSSFEVSDDKGNVYWCNGGQSRSSILGTRYLIHFDNLNKDATKIILNYDHYNRKMRFEISLKVGDNL